MLQLTWKICEDNPRIEYWRIEIHPVPTAVVSIFQSQMKV
jgi:hypothetical protein